ncbi:hypothetical protein BDP81DRAFT_223184 [Colletotrichum phormii]|uniref:Uncharacterized protein n=1 Tax=Colletotrichum phormii TaxID=359342 RepID=A0AAI9ZVH8_9PEZI|nr:uncharacterized protein BDP81DRAFT_223184 [Colletotrichum phormii]KAK1637382.1 hypothetical protein BDP81DRAFT_223184 [Colletotrichum phormii]
MSLFPRFAISSSFNHLALKLLGAYLPSSSEAMMEPSLTSFDNLLDPVLSDSLSFSFCLRHCLVCLLGFSRRLICPSVICSAP